MNDTEYTKVIKDQIHTDVLVIGGGPSGIAAAAAAARNGSKTLLIEQYGYLGGMATAALVGPFMTCFDGTGKVQLIRGVFDELITRLEKMGGAIHPLKIGFASSHAAYIEKGHSHVTPFDSEKLKIAAEDMMLESGVRLLYYTRFVDCIMDGENIKNVIVLKKEGLCTIKAKVYIDCSGDADVAAAAGVGTVLGRECDNLLQPATMFFTVNNVDSEAVEKAVKENWSLMKPFFGAFNWVINKGREEGKWSIARDELGMYETNKKGEWKMNTTRISIADATKSAQLTEASIEGRKQVQQVYQYIVNEIPGFENAKITEVASVIGIRESRHIRGKYVITKEDILKERTFDDDVVLCANSIDIHSDDEKGGEYVETKRFYGIPYRALVPNTCGNLLVAGRTISATSEAAAAFRVMPPCFGIGQAAGTAASICAGYGICPEKVNIDRLQSLLRSQNVFLEKEL